MYNHAAPKLKYKRVILKISGEIFGAEFNLKTIDYIIRQIISVHQSGVKLGVVVGGGNIIRGKTARWLDRTDADLCGMIGTIINGLVLYSRLRKNNINASLSGGIEVQGVVRKANKFEDLKFYESGGVLIFVGGTGNPLFTTDTAAAISAVEMAADILIKGTKVKGVYSEDPTKDKDARFYPRLKFDEAIKRNLMVMDMTAFNTCKEANIPICVYNLMKYPLVKIIEGKKIGTIIS